MISERLRQARLMRGLGLVGLSELTGLDARLLRDLERGARMPSSSQMRLIARACGVRTEYFFRQSNVVLTVLLGPLAKIDMTSALTLL